MASYSKASWGLSVQLRVTRVFTGRTTSPSLSSRQRSARYAIRAGRNLPDKELRLGLSRHFCQARTLSSSGQIYASFEIRMPGV
jgi:hypothetical protein